LVLVHFSESRPENAPTEGRRKQETKPPSGSSSQELQTAAHASFGPEACRVLELKNHATRTRHRRDRMAVFKKGRVLRGEAILYPAGAHWKDARLCVLERSGSSHRSEPGELVERSASITVSTPESAGLPRLRDDFPSCTVRTGRARKFRMASITTLNSTVST